MSFGAPGGTPKKDSVFSSIAPAQPAPAAMPAAAPVPRPAADPEAITALKQKIDVLERNIVAQLEKRLGEQAKPAAPPPPPPVHDLLYRKIEELERRLSDSAAVSASQLRNIEESKISARREIEDLLKAVREQQKYSEMDREMHAQLEKAWTRAEDLEKKLMDFYSSVIAMEAKRKDESAAVSDKSAAASDKVAAAVDALGARLERLEQRLAAAPIETLAQDMRKAQEEFVAKAARESASMLAAQEAAARDTLAGFRENATSLRDFFDNNFRRELAVLNERVAGETDALRREISSSLEESRRLLREQTAASAAKTEEFSKLLEAARLKSESAEAALEISSRRQALALEEFARRMDADLRAISSEYLAAARKDNDERFARFGAKYADALLSVTFVESFRAAVSEAIDKLDGHEARMGEFLKHVSPVQLERVLGVSGDIIRGEFDAMKAAAGGLKEDLARLRDIKRGIEQKVRDIFGES